jgi:hypothetical protein
MKLRRKLLSAGFALGATALTLTTSTFAWYTSNNEVSVAPVTGMTSTEADSTSIYIAAAKSYASVSESITASAPGAKVATIGKYGKELKASDLTLVNSGATRVLAPVYYASANTYQTMTDVSGENKDTPVYSTDSTASCVYEYVLRFQKPNASASTAVYVSKFEVANTATATDSQQQALANDNVAPGVGIAEEGLYNVDLLHALKMTVAVTNLTSTGQYETTPTVLSTTVYDLDSFATSSKDVNISTANAVGYYNAVLGTALSAPTNYLSDAVSIASASQSASNSASSQLFTIPATGYVEVRFTFWLDGWDEYCYDVCRKQNFSVEMAFSTEASKSVLTAA